MYMCVSEWQLPEGYINDLSLCTEQGQRLAHLRVDDADSGFIPHVSLVSLRGSGVEP